jgi:TonB family protein
MSRQKYPMFVGIALCASFACAQSVFVNNLVIPTYPPVAKVALIQGEVTVEIEIDRDGRVISARALGGDPTLVRSTELNVSEWTFGLTSEPKSFPVKHTITYAYKLLGKRTRDTGCTSKLNECNRPIAARVCFLALMLRRIHSCIQTSGGPAGPLQPSGSYSPAWPRRLKVVPKDGCFRDP